MPSHAQTSAMLLMHDAFCDAAVMTTLSCGAVYKLSAVACPRIWPSYAKLKAPQQRDWDSRSVQRHLTTATKPTMTRVAGDLGSLCVTKRVVPTFWVVFLPRVPSTIHAIAITAATAYTLGMTNVFQRSRLDRVRAVAKHVRVIVQPVIGHQDHHTMEYVACILGVLATVLPLRRRARASCWRTQT